MSSYETEAGTIKVWMSRGASSEVVTPGGHWLTQWLTIEGRDCEITVEPRPSYCDRGAYIAKLHPRGEFAREVDGQDGWPRYYFDFDRALQEIAAWLKKRGQMPEVAQ